MDQRTTFILLADTLAQHDGVTHFAISMRAFGKGDFFKGLKEGGDCRTATAARLMQWFSDHWPADLDWPRDIPRPQKTKEKAA
ncbi:hypothetical protein [Frigidibacter oleivorans]|uniref:hypothetical protein n=1 Tax=Frigidibacter oleivorans TaxID=2487129 RepID=UPI000F8E85BA|nr:hypothetical protein [Frigidibacter oleivorans]